MGALVDLSLPVEAGCWDMEPVLRKEPELVLEVER